QAAGDAGRRLVVDDDDRFDRVSVVGAEPRLDVDLRRAPAPVAGRVVDLQAEALRDLLPYEREVARLANQHAIAGRECVDERRLGRARPGFGNDDDGPGRLEHALKPLEDLGGQPGELGPAMIDDGLVHRTQDAIGDVGRSWNLKKVAARM